MVISSIICGWGSSAQRGGVMLLKKAQENPEKAASVIEFIVALVIYALIAAVIGAIAAAVGKFVFETDKEDTQKVFAGVAGVVLVICIICYFVF